MAIVLKVEQDGELRRKLFHGTPDYAAVMAALQDLWPDSMAYLAKYDDEDGDACTLADATFDDFLSTATNTPGRSVLRLRLFPAPPATPKGVPAEPATSNECMQAEPVEPVHPAGPRLDPFGVLGDDEDDYNEQEEEEEEDDNDRDAAAASLRAGAEAALGTMLGRFAQHCGPYSACSTSSSLSSDSSAPPTQTRDEGEEGMDMEEKICIVLAAFDDDGDGRLNCREWVALVKAAWGVDVPPMAYQYLCAHLGFNAQDGLNAADMACAYNLSGTLDWDFSVARRKLEESEGPAPRAADLWGPCAEPAPCF